MTKYLLFFSCLIFGFQSHAQMAEASGLHAKWTIKFSPLGLIEPDQAFSLATEFRPVSRIGIQLEGSYIFNSLYLAAERNITNTRGFRLVPELRYYDVHFRKNLQRYIGLQLSYKQMQKDVEEWIYKTNYTQLETISVKKNNFTATFIGGLQNNAHRLGFDFNIGLGFKYKTINNNSYFNDQNVFNTYFGETLGGYYPQLSATFKLCYRLL